MLKRNAAMIVVLAVFTIPAFFGSAFSASAVEIDAKTDSTLKMFCEKVGPAKELSAKAKGILIFPDVIKAGFGIGGEYGEGALRINGKTVEYYNTAAASIGLQLGAQEKQPAAPAKDGAKSDSTALKKEELEALVKDAIKLLILLATNIRAFFICMSKVSLIHNHHSPTFHGQCGRVA